jgi:hypothetical protein
MKVALRGQFYTRRAIYFRTLYESTSVLPEVHVRVQYDVVLSRKYFRTKVTTYCTCTRTRTVRVQYNVFHKVHIYRDKILSYESTLSTSVQYNVVHVHARESHVYNVVVYCTCTSEVRKYFRTFVLSYFRTKVLSKVLSYEGTFVLPYCTSVLVLPYFRTSVLPYFRTRTDGSNARVCTSVFYDRQSRPNKVHVHVVNKL